MPTLVKGTDRDQQLSNKLHKDVLPLGKQSSYSQTLIHLLQQLCYAAFETVSYYRHKIRFFLCFVMVFSWFSSILKDYIFGTSKSNCTMTGLVIILSIDVNRANRAN